MINEIEQHFNNNYPKESCGIIGIVRGKKEWFPCRNLAEGEHDFIMSSEDYLDICKKADIFAIVHNHIHTDNTPSEADIRGCNATGIPYYIFDSEMNLNILQPKTKAYPLIGREYKFGEADCFEAVRDWLAKENISIPPRALFEQDWWDKDLNYFCDDIIKQWGGKPVTDPEINDVLIFQTATNVPNHCGVYLGKDMFFHHAVNRLSCRESLYPMWAKHLVGIYRYEA